jgi:hypothetical protein
MMEFEIENMVSRILSGITVGDVLNPECLPKLVNEIRNGLRYAYAIGSENGRVAFTNPKKVRKIFNGEIIGIYNSMSEAGKSVGRSKKSISKCILGHTKTCGGFNWELEK